MKPGEGIPLWMDFRETGREPEEYRKRLCELTLLCRLPEEWFGIGYTVPTSTGPFWIVGEPELIVEAVGKSSMPFKTPDGRLFAVRPQGVAIPEASPVRWYFLFGAWERGRAGLLWTPPKKGK